MISEIRVFYFLENSFEQIVLSVFIFKKWRAWEDLNSRPSAIILLLIEGCRSIQAELQAQ